MRRISDFPSRSTINSSRCCALLNMTAAPRTNKEAPPVFSGEARLHIEDIIARRQYSAIVSIPVGSNPRDFFLFPLAQDDQRLLSMVFSRDRRAFPSASSTSLGEMDLQMSFH